MKGELFKRTLVRMALAKSNLRQELRRFIVVDHEIGACDPFSGFPLPLHSLEDVRLRAGCHFLL